MFVHCYTLHNFNLSSHHINVLFPTLNISLKCPHSAHLNVSGTDLYVAASFVCMEIFFRVWLHLLNQLLPQWIIFNPKISAPLPRLPSSSACSLSPLLLRFDHSPQLLHNPFIVSPPASPSFFSFQFFRLPT